MLPVFCTVCTSEVLAVISISASYNDTKKLAVIKESGFDGIDLDMSWDSPEYGGSETVWEKEDDAPLRSFLTDIDAAGLKCAQIHAIYPTYSGDPSKRERIIKILKKQIELCAYYRCGILVIHNGYRRYAEQLSDSESKEYNLGLFFALIPELKRYGVKACIENIFLSSRGKYYEGYFCRSEDICSLIDELNTKAGCECFGFCLDTGHALLCSKDIGHLVRGVGSRLKALHLNDNDGTDDQHTMPYSGKLDWQRLFEALRDTGYSGPINFEMLIGYIPEPVYADALRFISSVGRYASSMICGK